MTFKSGASFGNFIGFSKDTAVLSASTALSQAVMLLSSPLLTRRYTADNMGEAALFIVIAGMCGQLSCLKYDVALIVSKEDKTAYLMRKVCFLSTVLICLLSSLIMAYLCLFEEILNGRWLWFSPTILFIGVFTALSAEALRRKSLYLLAVSTLIRSCVQVGIQLFFYQSYDKPMVLCLAYMISYAAASAVLFFKMKRNEEKSSFREALGLAKKYKKYPKMVLPGAASIDVAYTLDSMVLSGCFQTAALGYYQVMNRLTAAPLALISTPAGQLFLRRFSLSEKKHRMKFYIMVSAAMLVIAAIVVVLLVWLAPYLPAILGKGWEIPGEMLLVTLPLFAVRFTVTPVTSAAIAMGNERAVMIWQIVMMVFSGIAALTALFMKISIYEYLLLFGGMLGAGYLVYWVVSLKMIIAAGKTDDK